LSDVNKEWDNVKDSSLIQFKKKDVETKNKDNQDNEANNGDGDDK